MSARFLGDDEENKILVEAVESVDKGDMERPGKIRSRDWGYKSER